MQTVRYFFVDGFTVYNGLHRFHSHTAFYKTPVIFFRIFFDGIISVTETLSITAVSALEHIEIQPRCIVEPSSRSRSATRVECHQMVLVDCFDGGCQCFPFGSLHITTDIPTDKPDNVRFVFIAFCQELAVCFCLIYIHFAMTYRTSPDADHADIKTFLCCGTDNVIHVIPITIYAFLIDILEVVAVSHGILSVDIHRRDIIQCLNLNHVISAAFALFQIIFGFVTIQTLRQQPAGFSQPEERSAVFVFQITSFFRNDEFAVAPWDIRLLCFLLCCGRGCQCQQQQ